MNEFFCEARKSGDTIVTTVRGELDFATSHHVVSAAEPWMAPGVRVVVDCSGITFMDSRGLHAMLELRRMANHTGAELTLTAVPQAVSRVFQIAGVEAFFTTAGQLPVG